MSECRRHRPSCRMIISLRRPQLYLLSAFPPRRVILINCINALMEDGSLRAVPPAKTDEPADHQMSTQNTLEEQGRASQQILAISYKGVSLGLRRPYASAALRQPHQSYTATSLSPPITLVKVVSNYNTGTGSIRRTIGWTIYHSRTTGNHSNNARTP